MGWMGNGCPLSLVPLQPPPLHGPQALHPSPAVPSAELLSSHLEVGGGLPQAKPQPGGGPRGLSLCGQNKLQLWGAPSCLGAAGPLHAPGPPFLTPSCLAPGR